MIHLFAVPQDVLLQILLFLWFPDIFNLMQCSRDLQRDFSFNALLWERICHLLLSKVYGINPSPHTQLRFCHPKLSTLCQRIPPWPSAIDLVSTRNKQHGPDHIVIEGLTARYVGQRFGKDRAIVANCHFPVKLDSRNRLIESNLRILSDKRIAHRPFKNDSNFFDLNFSSVPFTKFTFEKRDANVPILTLSYVAYFECTILPAVMPARGIFPMGWSPCVSVGLSCPSFLLKKKQPGWDRCSFGYHSDDGNFFHGDGIGESMGLPFGENDTVGCNYCLA